LTEFLRTTGIDLLMDALSAPPLNPIFTNSAFGLTVRPDLVPGVPLYLYDPTFAGGSRINRAAFATFTTPRQGTLGRNALRGFNAAQANFAIHREFGFTERFRADLRFEAFNLFNHPNFASAQATVTNALFERSTQMLNRGLGGLNAL
jgi:hypothetical protein